MKVNCRKKLRTSLEIHMELAGEGFPEEVMIPKQSFRGSTCNNKHKNTTLGRLGHEFVHHSFWHFSECCAGCYDCGYSTFEACTQMCVRVPVDQTPKSQSQGLGEEVSPDPVRAHTHQQTRPGKRSSQEWCFPRKELRHGKLVRPEVQPSLQPLLQRTGHP